MKKKCPICKSNKAVLLEKVRTPELIKMYNNFFKEDIGYLFGSISEIEYLLCENCEGKYFYPLVSGDEKFYNLLQKFSWYYSDEKIEYDIAKKYMKDGEKVLEVGSGKGAFRKYIQGSDYTGLEFSKEAKLMAEKNNIIIINESIEEHAKKNPEKYDTVLSFQVLEHVLDVNSFILSKLKTLKKSGKLIIAVPSEDSFLRDVTNGILNMPPHHLTRYSDKTLKNIAKLYNLEVIDIIHEKIQPIHYNFFNTTRLMKKIMAPKLIDNSVKRKIASKIISKITRANFNQNENGHTVVAIYKKK